MRCFTLIILRGKDGVSAKIISLIPHPQQLTANNVKQQVTAPRMNHQGWNSHVDGAIALLKARGPEEFQSPVGREMWHCVRALAVSLLLSATWEDSY
jgi:hypothetical protein